MAFKCKTHCQKNVSSIRYKGTIIRHLCSMWEIMRRAYRFRLFFIERQQKQTHLWLGLKRNVTLCLISPSLIPAEGEREVYHAELGRALSDSCPAHDVLYHIHACEMENGCGCYGRMKTMSGSRRLKWPDRFQPLRLSRDGGGGGASGNRGAEFTQTNGVQ